MRSRSLWQAASGRRNVLEIVVNDVVKTYKDIIAVDHVSLSIEKGSVCGIIGPNGAGKTTLMEIMLGLRKQDSGTVTIDGMDNIKDHRKLVYHIGAQLQESELPANIKVREAINLQAALFKVKPDVRKLLEEFNLLDKAGAYCSKLSGGQRQRLFILLAVIHDPEIVFFDELSTGLDPVSRQEVWNYVKRLKKRDKTIIVSTHYMQEAEEICDNVMLINNGVVVDSGSPAELTAKLPFSQVVTFEALLSEGDVKDRLKTMRDFAGMERLSSGKYRAFAGKSFSIDRLRESGIDGLKGLQVRESCFEDYFYYKVKIKG